MAAAKKAAKTDTDTELRKLISDVEEAVSKFNAIHLENVPSEAPMSAWARVMGIQIKHMVAIADLIKAIEQSNDTNEDKEEEGGS